MTVPVPLSLSPEEQRLVLALRDIPESPLRRRFGELVTELVEFVSHPTCAEMQADGAPCTSAQTSCDECRKVSELLDGLRRRLDPARPPGASAQAAG
jgi:hypothetical protein